MSDDGDGTDFHGQSRSNKTHESTTDADVRLYKKSYGKESKLSYPGHALVENRNGLITAVWRELLGFIWAIVPRLLLALSSNNGKSNNNGKKNPTVAQASTGSLHIKAIRRDWLSRLMRSLMQSGWPDLNLETRHRSVRSHRRSAGASHCPRIFP